jgi:hypothetical protein
MRKAGLSGSVFLCALLLWLGFGWAQEYSFTYTCDNQGVVIHPDSVGVLVTLLANTGAQADTYRVVLDKDMPGGWQCMACLSYGCFFDSASVPVAAAEVETLALYMMPQGSVGAGAVTMRVRSLGDPGQKVVIPLTAITNTGVGVLVVDDDGTEDYEVYYQVALDSTGRTHGTLHKATTIIGADELAPFQAVVWFTGEATPVLIEGDRQAISAYLEGGGRLFVSGQDIAYALCDSASAESDSASVAWFEDTFWCEYLENDSDTLMLDGIPGDPISDGLTLNIFDGDGANNQSSPDVILPFPGFKGNPFPVFYYAGSWSDGACKLDNFTEGYRLVYFGFGFEAIDNALDRATVMDKVMDWLLSPTAVEHHQEIASRPLDFSLSPNYPNPFNATTSFTLYVSGENPCPISVKIYNVLGQEVRTLVDGITSPGNHLVVWDGKDHLGRQLASGVYFSRLQVGNLAQTRKLVLTR